MASVKKTRGRWHAHRSELSRLGRNMLEKRCYFIIPWVKKGQRSSSFGSRNYRPPANMGSCCWHLFVHCRDRTRIISMRTKDGLKAARADGKLLGRPKGSKSRNRRLDPFKEQIRGYLCHFPPLYFIWRLWIIQLERPVSYNTLRYYVESDIELHRIAQLLPVNLFWQINDSSARLGNEIMQILIGGQLCKPCHSSPRLWTTHHHREVFELLDQGPIILAQRSKRRLFWSPLRMDRQAKRLQEFEWREEIRVLRKPPAKLQSKISVMTSSRRNWGRTMRCLSRFGPYALQ